MNPEDVVAIIFVFLLLITLIAIGFSAFIALEHPDR